MDTAVFSEDVVVKKVSIVGTELVENYTVYVIEVTVRDHRWIIKHRYSDFHDLHEKLTAEKKIEKHLLPPKKMIGKNSKSLVEKRQKELEVYLQTLLVRFPTAAPKVLSYFLHFHQYEMNGITAALAEELFHKGEQLLVAGEVFTLCPLQLYAITQQLKLAKPTCSNGDAKADLGHILDFTCRLKYLKITGTRGEVGTSNIQEDSLTFDLSVFKALLQIEISDCNSAQIMGLPSLKPCLVTLSVHHSAASMMDVLVPESCESPQWVAEGALTDCPVTTIIPTWKTLTTLDMSHNHIGCIDSSVKLIPKVEFLDLSSNELSMVENLQHLYNLIHLDLSYNVLTVLEGAHTKLGNIKTLNLAGNQLDSLAGLTKLYSLVNLDLSSNKLGQLEEIRYIGTLPCLERLILSNNPMCIIPDYRTKVLAQFWDRASEVCLDSTAPTEKELDTVEVLKAIQKAKESKDRMANNNEKKISEDSRLSGGGSSISSSVAAASSSSSSSLLSSALAPACSSQEVICKEEAFVTPTILTPVDFIALDTQRCYDDVNTLPCEEQLQVTSHQPDDDDDSSSFEHSGTQQNQNHRNTGCCCCCVEDREERYTWSNTNLRTPVLPLYLPSSSTSSCPSFTSLLSARITKALEEEDRRPSRLRDLPSQEETDLGTPSPSPSPSSGDGYFEMGLGEGKERDGEEGSPTDQVEGENQAPETEVLRVTKVMWCHCIRVDDVVEQRSVCVVLTNSLLGLFHCPSHPSTAPTHQPQSQPHDLGSVTVQTLVDNLELDLVLPYDQLDSLLFYIPDTCLSLRVKSSNVRWYLFSDPQGLKETHSLLCSLAQLPSSPSGGPSTPQQLLHLLFTSWEFEENQGCVKSGYTAHLVETSMLSPQIRQTSQQTTTSTNPTLTPMKTSTDLNTFAPYQTLTNPLLSDILSHIVPGEDRDFSCCVPCVLFLTQRHLCVLKVDFKALARGTTGDEPSDDHNQRIRSCSRLTRIPLASVLPHPRPSALYGAGAGSRQGSVPAYSPSCPLPWHHRSPRDGRVMELLVGQERVTAVFPLPHDRLRFQRQFTLLRSSLRDIKTVAFLQGGNEHSHSDGDSPRTINIYTSTPNETKSTDRLQVNSPRGSQRPRPSLSMSYPTDILVEKLTGDNQVPSHLSLSPALSLVSGLRGHQLLGFFHTNIAEEEKEELHHILWSSVVFYKSPDVEATSCIMLSTKALYFLLDDSASTLNDQSLLWDWSHCDHQDPELIMSYCLTIDLHDLQSVNVGLFDQYFRVVGPSADHIICCLTRDSYGTHRFLQQLMMVLSLQDKLPSPEPSEQDFYTQFGNKSTGKMENYELVHSSRVKFIYPSEEEIGDLTFIVAERKGPSGASSCNILLYVLVFQVQTQGPGFSQGLNVLPQTQAPAADRQTCTGGRLQGDRQSHLQPQSPVSASQPRLHPYPQVPGPAPSIRPHIPQQSLAPSTPRPVLHPKTLILTSTDVFLLDEDYISYPLPDFAKEPPPRDKYQLTDARRIRDLDRVLMGYQTYPQALTLVFDDVPGPDLLCQLTMDHFGEEEEEEVGGGGGENGRRRRRRCGGTENEVLWCVYVPGADSRERLICLLARQWEVLCSRELPVELTG